MTVFQGKGVYSAVALGKVSVFKRAEAKAERVAVDDPAAEIARVEAAKEQAIKEYEGYMEYIGKKSGGDISIWMK